VEAGFTNIGLVECITVNFAGLETESKWLSGHPAGRARLLSTIHAYGGLQKFMPRSFAFVMSGYRQ
jgi:hypothetical protein